MDSTLAAEGLETTGRYIITYKEGGEAAALAMLSDSAGVAASAMMSSSDYGEDGVDISQIDAGGGVMLQHLGIAVVNAPPDAAVAMAGVAADDASPILAVEPEGIMYAIGELSADYMQGFADAAAHLAAKMGAAGGGAAVAPAAGVAAAFADTGALTWGLQATKAGVSPFTGQGIKVAILDTGLFLAHPDFVGRPIVPKSFIPGVVSVNDGHGHGTHCTGTACGPLRPPIGRRYGIAHQASIYIGKVLSDGGSGPDLGILAGIDWAVANRCEVISMSLGARVPSTSVAYETAGQRALNANCLIVAAAGNGANRPTSYSFVERPANSRSVMAVAAVDGAMQIARFSARDTAQQPGTAVDIAGPGVAVYSTWPMNARYNTISGTSMATPHVAGIAALWAQKTGLRGAALWQHMLANAKALPGLPGVDVGRGLVQAP